MSEIRDKISKATGFYFREISFAESFIRLQKGGQFDTRMLIKIVGEICDYLEEKEKPEVFETEVETVLDKEIEKPKKKVAKKKK